MVEPSEQVFLTEFRRRVHGWLAGFLISSDMAILLALVIVGLAARLWYLSIAGLASDEGIFVYEANRLLHGAVPYRDVLVKDPLYSYLVAVAVAVGGYDIMSVRLLTVLFGTAGIPAVYALGRYLFSSKAGIIAAAILALSPASLVYETLADPRAPMLFLSTIVIAALALALNKGSSRMLYVLAAVLGVLIWFHRIFGIFIITFPLVFLFLEWRVAGDSIAQRNRGARRVVKRSALFWLIAGIAALIPLLVFALVSSPAWVYTAWISGGRESAGDFIDPSNPFSSLNARLLHDAVREWFQVFLPASAFLFYAAILTRVRHTPSGQTMFFGLAVLFLGFLLAGFVVNPVDSFGSYLVPLWREYAFAALVLVTVPLAHFSRDQFALSVRPWLNSPSTFVVVYWAVQYVVFLALVNTWILNYFQYFAYPLALMAGVVLLAWLRAVHHSPRGKSRGIAVALIAAVLVGAAISASTDLSANRTWRPMSHEQLNQVAALLSEQGQPGDTVLTGFPSISVLSGIPLTRNITRLQFYAVPGLEDPMPYDHFNLVPSIPDIARTMESGEATFVVADHLLVDIFSIQHPILWDHVQVYYSRIANIKGIDVYRHV